MPRLAIADLEADNLLKDVTIVWCAVFYDVDAGKFVKFFPGSHPDYIQAMLDYMDSCETLVMHNGIGYDWPALKKLYNYDYKGIKVDTLIMSRILNTKRRAPHSCPNKRAPHSVEAWGYRFGVYKPEHEDWSQFSEHMLHRCTEDVRIQTMIWNALKDEANGFKTGTWKHALPLTYKLFEILGEQERYGWLMDKEHMRWCWRTLTKWMECIDRVVTPLLPMVREIEETKKDGEYNYVKKPFKKNGELAAQTLKWCEKTGVPPASIQGQFSRINFRLTNLDSNAETKDFLLACGWEPQEYNISKKTGQRASPKLSSDDPFKGVDGRAGKLLAKRVQCRHRRSTIEGWARDLRADGRLSGRVTGLAATGRATHGTIVNVPGGDSFFGKYMRKCFTSKDGYVIVGTDSAGCQNRMLAARVGDPAFTATLLEGKKADKTDIHNVNRNAIIDLVEKEFSEKYLKKSVGVWPLSRHDAKTCNYATLFGGGGKKVGSAINAPAEVGEVIKRAIFGVAPGFQQLMDDLTKEWRATAKRRMNKWNRLEYYEGYITGLDGRPILIEQEHTLLVYMLQSDEAIMMTAAYCFLYKWATEKFGPHGDKWGFVVWMHDEFQCEVREDIADEFARLAEKAIEYAGRYFKIQCEHKGESDIGQNWFDTH